MITALTSNGMIAPSYWIDPKTGNNYMLTVQYSDNKIGNMSHGRFQADSACAAAEPNRLHAPASRSPISKQINTPTEVDHYQIRRVIDVYVMPSTEALQRVNQRCQQGNRRNQDARNVARDRPRKLS